jgi:hypothetical protein
MCLIPIGTGYGCINSSRYNLEVWRRRHVCNCSHIENISYRVFSYVYDTSNRTNIHMHNSGVRCHKTES